MGTGLFFYFQRADDFKGSINPSLSAYVLEIFDLGLMLIT